MNELYSQYFRYVWISNIGQLHIFYYKTERIHKTMSHWSKDRLEAMEFAPLIQKDYEVIEAAQRAIQANYDQENCNHTVGAAVLCKSGKILLA